MLTNLKTSIHDCLQNYRQIPNFKFELNFLRSIVLFEPRREKTCFWGFRPGKTNRPVQLQTS